MLLLLLLFLQILLSSFLLSLLLSLLSEVPRPKSLPITAHSQSGGSFNSDSQAALQYILSDWAHVQRSTVRLYKQREDDVMKHQ